MPKNKFNKKSKNKEDGLIKALKPISDEIYRTTIRPADLKTQQDDRLHKSKGLLRQILIILLHEARHLLLASVPGKLKGIQINSIALPERYGIGNCQEHAFLGLHRLLRETDHSEGGIKGIKQILPLFFIEKKKDYDHSHALLVILPEILHNRGTRRYKSISYEESEFGKSFEGNVETVINALLEKTQEWKKPPILFDPFHNVVCSIRNIPKTWTDRYYKEEKANMGLMMDFFNCLYPLYTLKDTYLQSLDKSSEPHLEAYYKILANNESLQKQHEVLNDFIEIFKEVHKTFLNLDSLPIEQFQRQYADPGFSQALYQLSKDIRSSYLKINSSENIKQSGKTSAGKKNSSESALDSRSKPSSSSGSSSSSDSRSRFSSKTGSGSSSSSDSRSRSLSKTSSSPDSHSSSSSSSRSSSSSSSSSIFNETNPIIQISEQKLSKCSLLPVTIAASIAGVAIIPCYVYGIANKNAVIALSAIVALLFSYAAFAGKAVKPVKADPSGVPGVN